MTPAPNAVYVPHLCPCCGATFSAAENDVRTKSLAAGPRCDKCRRWCKVRWGGRTEHREEAGPR